MASPVENQVEDATVGEEEEEEEGGEPSLFFNVPYIHNGYILEHLGKHGNTATANMLVELPLCRHKEIRSMASSVTRLKNKRAKLVTQRSKSSEGENNFQQFLDAEFVFPAPSNTQRS